MCNVWETKQRRRIVCAKYQMKISQIVWFLTLPQSNKDKLQFKYFFQLWRNFYFYFCTNGYFWHINGDKCEWKIGRSKIKSTSQWGKILTLWTKYEPHLVVLNCLTILCVESNLVYDHCLRFAEEMMSFTVQIHLWVIIWDIITKLHKYRLTYEWYVIRKKYRSESQFPKLESCMVWCTLEWTTYDVTGRPKKD